MTTTTDVMLVLNMLFFLPSVALWVAWFWRIRANAEVFAPGRVRYHPGWAIGAWFVPVVCFFMPKQIMNDVCDHSDPASSHAAWYGPRRSSNRGLLNGWWTLWLTVFLGWWVNSEIWYEAGTVGDAEGTVALSLFTDLLTVPAAVLAILVALRLTSLQEDRIKAGPGRSHPRAAPLGLLLGLGGADPAHPGGQPLPFPAPSGAAQHQQPARQGGQRDAAADDRCRGQEVPGPGPRGGPDTGVDEGRGEHLPGAADGDHRIAAAGVQIRPYGRDGPSLPGRSALGAVQSDGPLEGGRGDDAAPSARRAHGPDADGGAPCAAVRAEGDPAVGGARPGAVRRGGGGGGGQHQDRGGRAGGQGADPAVRVPGGPRALRGAPVPQVRCGGRHASRG
ncbi:DUF4328 domain-containing protein, partial [Streptomyces sp. URMC 125]|uniref:DUF4328 domain-containing protein n=1 Tax=Streptomyces sp. URMC 125 TaxID=3423419 RepID=UPI003F196809